MKTPSGQSIDLQVELQSAEGFPAGAARLSGQKEDGSAIKLMDMQVQLSDGRVLRIDDAFGGGSGDGGAIDVEVV